MKQLLRRDDDVSLRLLEEIYDDGRSRYALFRPGAASSDSYRLRKLEGLQRELREFLRLSIEEEDFPRRRDQPLRLLDEIEAEMIKLQQREPFDGIQDPEKSLLIDILQELDSGNTVVRQKAQQLGNIIKIKHQELLQLRSDNMRAAVWTKWGTTGTIFFGVLSLALSISSILNCPACSVPP